MKTSAESSMGYFILALLLCTAAVLASPFAADNNEQLTESPSYIAQFDDDSGLKPSDGAYLAWLHFMFSQMKAPHQTQPALKKRFSDFSVPYFKYRQDKRNDGIWIWMPAQGYVSVPKQQQAMGGDAAGKPGKIMRYGK